MSGIYIHIPYCKKACHYCNFHFSTSLQTKDAMVDAIVQEMQLRSSPYKEDLIQTIYFGGGTPSLLNAKDLNLIFNGLYKVFNVADNVEITLEANPDDLDHSYLKTLDESPINRLSIGIQSFHDEDLKWMNRAHNAEEAKNSIQLAQDIGFDNLSIDLIFGSPSTTMENWIKNLEMSFAYDVNHISCYALTVEPKTALEKMIQLKKSKAVNDKLQTNQFVKTMELMKAADYDHYEISNYCKPGKESRHNTNYWKSKKYLGLGPAAHSFDGKDRYFNISNNLKYIESLNDGKVFSILDQRNQNDIYNEYVMTRLRTKWGCDLATIALMGSTYLHHFEQEIKKTIDAGFVFNEEKNYKLTEKGKLFADHISSELFYI